MPFAPYIVVGLVLLGTKVTNDTGLDRVLTAVLMPALALGVVLVLLRRRRLARHVVVLLLAGIALSWLGDNLLPFSFIAGLGFFLVAHLAYVAMFATAVRPRRVTRWGLLLMPWFIVLLVVLAPSLGALLPVVAVYGAVLALMTLAASTAGPVPAVGGILFLLSDSFLAFRMFTPLFQDDLSELLIMAAYIAAQLAIAVGVLRRGAVRSPASAATPAAQ